MPASMHAFEQFAKSVMSRLLPLSFAEREEMQVLINQGIDPVEARALVQGYVSKAGDFDEAKHPRDHGEFASAGGSSGVTPAQASSPHLRESKRQEKDAGRALERAKAARANGENDRADRHMAESRQHLSNAKEALDAHRASQASPKAADKPAAKPEPQKGASATSQQHFENAQRSLDRADNHQAKAAEARASGNDEQANAHLTLANQANAAARRELTNEQNDHAGLNRAREAKGQGAYAHDDKRHAELSSRHEDNRAKIAAAKPTAGGDKAKDASTHTERAEHAIGASRAKEQAGDKEGAKQKMVEAKAEVARADKALSKPGVGTGAEQTRQLGAQIRNTQARAQTKEKVDTRHLDAAKASQQRAQAHDKASATHAEHGNGEHASHHGVEAAHARHEGHSSLAKFGEILEAAADRSLEKSAGSQKTNKSEALTQAYLKAFYASAEAKLPKWQQGHLKNRAKRAIKKKPGAKKLQKDGMLMSDVHVNVPLGGKAQAVALPKVTQMKPHIHVMKGDANEIAYINQALNLQDPTYREFDNGNGAVDAHAAVALEAHRLVQGMDMEMANSELPPEKARQVASRTLLDRPGYYDTVGATPDMLGNKGIMIDLGSGPSRAMGHIGIDLHPYDYGTVLWDLDLGIPFPDSCARAVRMTHSLHPILDAYGKQRSPVPLLLEVQRVLIEGGQFYYEGPEPLYEAGDPWPLPGLALISSSDDDRLSPNSNAPVAQTFRRIPLRVPAFAGADSRYAPARAMSIDAAMAMLAMNASPAELAMANLVAKHEHTRHVPIVKADSEKQICYGEVLNPLTIDTQSDWLTAGDIEKAAHDYMMRSRVIGSEHGDPIGAAVVESFVAPQDLNFMSPGGPVAVPKGTWLIGVKISDPQEWAKVKSGEYSGFSVGGVGVREAGMPNALAA